MKHALAIIRHSSLFILHSSFFILHSASSAEVVVYSPPSASPLHVAVLSTNDMTISAGRVFPASHTGHRAVCVMPNAATNDTFCAWIGGDAFAPGDPFGVSSLREYPAVGLARTSAVTPRFDLWSGAVDRGDSAARVEQTANTNFQIRLPEKSRVRVRVMRYKVDDFPVHYLGVPATVMFDRIFQGDVRAVIHEGDFLRAGALDLDWNDLENDVVDWRGSRNVAITNMQYLVVLDDTDVGGDRNRFDIHATNIVVHPLLITRQFERNRTAPTAAGPQGMIRTTSPKFAWKIENEDAWASEFGTTYTAFKLKLWSGSSTNSTPIVSTGFVRMPPADSHGVYSHWLDQPLQPNATYTWQVFAYNSKFKTDKSGSAPLTFTTDLTE